MKWKKQYVVLTEDSIYMHGHRRVGFGTPLRHGLTPNSMIFSTTLKGHSFEVRLYHNINICTYRILTFLTTYKHHQLVLFSDSIHFCAASDGERGEWMYVLQRLIPRSKYDESDSLQLASLEKDPEVFVTEFTDDCSPGLLLERRGNWAIAALVSETLSRKVCPGSVLSRIGDEEVTIKGFDAIVTALSYWTPPLRLTFILSPRKMGWLTLMVKQPSAWWNTMIGKRRKASDEAVWGESCLSLFVTFEISLNSLPDPIYSTLYYKSTLTNLRKGICHTLIWSADTVHHQERWEEY